MGARPAPSSFRPFVHLIVAAVTLPLFPLAGALLFPRAQLPLHIFEPRYRDLVNDVLDGPGRIGIIQPRDPEGNADLLYDVGCIGEIVSVEELDDGRFNIVLLGTGRFRLLTETDLGTPYRNASVDCDSFDDDEPDPLALAVRAEVESEARRLGDALGLSVDWDAVARLDDEMLVNAIAQVAPFDLGAKQALLEERTLAGRADMLVQLMLFQRMAIRGADIQPTLQ